MPVNHVVRLAPVVAFAVAVGLVLGAVTSTASNQAASIDFPPGSYLIDHTNGQVGSLVATSQTFRLDYTNAHEWTMTMLSHSSEPAYVGSWWSFSGQTARSF